MNDCTCDVRPPRRESAIGGLYGRRVYVDEIHDDTRIDPACPFHGDEGTMVVLIRRDTA
jgi:hypothetical protein